MEARIADLESRLRRGDRRESVETAFWALMHNVFPDETRKHMKAAACSARPGRRRPSSSAPT